MTAIARHPGWVACAARRQGVGACAAPDPLHPHAPRWSPVLCGARRRRGGTTPSAYAAQAAPSITGEDSLKEKGAAWLAGGGKAAGAERKEWENLIPDGQAVDRREEP